MAYLGFDPAPAPNRLQRLLLTRSISSWRAPFIAEEAVFIANVALFNTTKSRRRKPLGYHPGNRAEVGRQSRYSSVWAASKFRSKYRQTNITVVITDEKFSITDENHSQSLMKIILNHWWKSFSITVCERARGTPMKVVMNACLMNGHHLFPIAKPFTGFLQSNFPCILNSFHIGQITTGRHTDPILREVLEHLDNPFNQQSKKG